MTGTRQVFRYRGWWWPLVPCLVALALLPSGFLDLVQPAWSHWLGRPSLFSWEGNSAVRFWAVAGSAMLAAALAWLRWRSFEVTADSLTERHWFRTRRLAWSQVQAVRDEGGSAQVLYLDAVRGPGALRLGPQVSERQALVALVRQHAGAAPDLPPLSPALVLVALGGGRLSIAATRSLVDALVDAWVYGLSVTGLMVTAVATGAIIDGHMCVLATAGVDCMPIGLAVGIPVALIRWLPVHVTADAEGLVITGPTYWRARRRWSELRAAGPTLLGCWLQTEHETLWCYAQDNRPARLLNAARTVLEARLAGQLTEPATTVPDGALSRAAPAGVAAERGLSRTSE